MSFNRLNTLLILLLLSGCSGNGSNSTIEPATTAIPSKPSDEIFQLHFPNQDKVQFLGKIDTSQKAGDGAAVMYPGEAGVAGFVAAIAAHSIAASSVKNSRKKQMQESANRILQPFSQVIEQLAFEQLYPQSLTLPGNTAPTVNLEPYSEHSADNKWIIESTPTFYVTLEKKDLILQNAIRIYESAKPDNSAYQNTIAVVFNDTGTHLSNDGVPIDNGNPFASTVKNLFKESLDLAISDFINQQSPPDSYQTTTVRYLEDGEKKVERGNVMISSCEKIVFKTLRKWIKSVPQMKKDNQQC